MNKVLSNIDVVTPFRVRKNCGIVIEHNKITQLGKMEDIIPPSDSETIDLSGKTVIPGLIDLHIHGTGGYNFIEPDSDKIDDLTQTLLSHGITGILVTVCPQSKKDLIKTVRYFAENIPRIKKNNILLGIHLEGPFLNKKMHGAFNPDYCHGDTPRNKCSQRTEILQI